MPSLSHSLLPSGWRLRDCWSLDATDSVKTFKPDWPEDCLQNFYKLKKMTEIFIIQLDMNHFWQDETPLNVKLVSIENCGHCTCGIINYLFLRPFLKNLNFSKKKSFLGNSQQLINISRHHHPTLPHYCCFKTEKLFNFFILENEIEQKPIARGCEFSRLKTVEYVRCSVNGLKMCVRLWFYFEFF